jgi:hypothetical protein
MKIFNKKILKITIFIAVVTAGYVVYTRQYPTITFATDSLPTTLEFDNKTITLNKSSLTFHKQKGVYSYQATHLVGGQTRHISGEIDTNGGLSQKIKLNWEAFSESSIRNVLCGDIQNAACLLWNAPLQITFVENDAWAVVFAEPSKLERNASILTMSNGSFVIVDGPGTDLDVPNGDYPPGVQALFPEP